MNDIEELRKSGLLLTDKQYKKLLAVALIMVILPNAFVLTGGLLAIFATDFSKYGFEIFISGMVLAGVNFVIMLFNLFYIWVQILPRLNLYRDYKKHPQDYENNENA